jgi:phosphoglycerate dehydrogenase-like enzyme
MINVLIASPLPPELVERIASLDPRLNITYRADLLGQPRYPGDHFPPISRTSAQTEEWFALLAQAEVMLDVDQPSVSDFRRLAPNVRWIQSSSSGIGEWVRRLGIVDIDVVATNAAGIHARPLAEYVTFAMLYFAKRWPRMAAEQRARHWQRCAIETLEGKTLGIIGIGRVGGTVAKMAKPFGVRTLGVRRTANGPSSSDVDTSYQPDGLREVLRQSDYLALCVPHTSETIGMIGAAELACLPAGAVVINVSRGSIVDESALIASLQAGHLGGAALDVVAREPLSNDSPLWQMDNVLITPHSMSTAVDENARLTELFCDNLRRYLDRQPLRNVVDKQRGY